MGGKLILQYISKFTLPEMMLASVLPGKNQGQKCQCCVTSPNWKKPCLLWVFSSHPRVFQASSLLFLELWKIWIFNLNNFFFILITKSKFPEVLQAVWSISSNQKNEMLDALAKKEILRSAFFVKLFCCFCFWFCFFFVSSPSLVYFSVQWQSFNRKEISRRV